MHQIQCPKCGEVFTVDESGYAAILKQVRDQEFQKEILAREAQLQSDKAAAVQLAQAKAQTDLQAALARKDAEIAALNAKLSQAETEKRLAVTQAERSQEQALSAQKEQIVLLSGRIENEAQAAQLKEQSLREGYEQQLRSKDELIAYYKDFKARQSTKMVGESLEQHCEMEFNKLRATGFQNAYFEKDNDARTGSK
ncbi:MAG: DUF2130 domain-containing protein, partial [Oscillospiraceae bacterium]|nr:DUF2130 domain-containing protein [Oscillospiraceae bacterium]